MLLEFNRPGVTFQQVANSAGTSAVTVRRWRSRLRGLGEELDRRHRKRLLALVLAGRKDNRPMQRAIPKRDRDRLSRMLGTWTRASAPTRLRRYARAVVALLRGATLDRAAEAASREGTATSIATAQRWQNEFLDAYKENDVTSLRDRLRAAQRRKRGREKKVVKAKALLASGWSTRRVGEKLGLSQSAVARLKRALT